ncbi:hypothetical protein SAMN05421663_101491 [Terribacillus halophilus]|uniref:Uncharacterized protein n=1 Tax=Terribacillus halophilus TaxID=361279 RepID=A0A1G6J6F6_9BACI|nr:hypothetical protein [Terribacillus halophilus]SDC14290.1 hypothetical protein SAMN05421663_101491 [Terribacillus halophilus]
MVKRLSFVFVLFVLAIIVLFLAAANPTGPNTVSFEEPSVIWLNVGIIALLFLPPFILSFFSHIAVKIVSAIYQAFIVFAFSSLILAGLLIPSVPVIVVAGLGTILSICSIFVTILTGLKKGKVVTE